MKRITVLAFSLLLMLTAVQAQDGIAFEQQSWEDILAKASKADKVIFLDAYASWCGPCKMMSRNVFTDESVADFYNTKFVNAKIDMEKGEGVELANKYKVQAYPTLLYINGEGEVVHRAVGYHDAEGFVGLGKTALDPSQRLGALRQQYESGKRDPELLAAYAKAAMSAMSPNAEAVVKDYLDTQDDWTTPENMEMVLSAINKPEGKLYQFLLDNRSAYEAAYGEDMISSTINRLIMGSLDPSMGEEAYLTKAEEKLEAAFPDKAGKMMAELKMNYYSYAQKSDQYAKAAVAYFDTYGSDNYNQLNNVAWSFYENVEDEAMLQKALGWAKKSVELTDAYFNNDTLAALYYKLGQYKKAEKAAKHAIELAKLRKQDYSGTQELLQKIQQEKN